MREREREREELCQQTQGKKIKWAKLKKEARIERMEELRGR